MYIYILEKNVATFLVRHWQKIEFWPEKWGSFLRFWFVFGRSTPHFKHEGKIKIPTDFQKKIYFKKKIFLACISFFACFFYLFFFWYIYIFFVCCIFFWNLFFFLEFIFCFGIFGRYETKSIWFCILNICISFHRISRKLYVLSIVAFCYKGMIHNVLLLHSSFHTD